MKVLSFILIFFILSQPLSYSALVGSSLQEFNVNKNAESSTLSKLIIYQASSVNACAFIQKTIDVKDYGFSSNHLFRFLSDASLNLNSTIINNLGNIAEKAYSILVSFFNATPYDQSKEGFINVAIANLNEAYNQSQVFVAGYTIPKEDPNNKSIIYLDSHYVLTSSYNETYVLFAHELFHLIQASVINISSHEDWVIEGTAVFASDLAIKGYSPLYNSIYLAYNKFNVSLRTPAQCLSLDAYIADYLIAPTFFEFLAEKYGNSAISKLLWKLKGNSDIRAIEIVSNTTFDRLFSEFAVWNYLGLYHGTEYTFEKVKIYAFPLTSLVINSTYANSIAPLSIHYIRILAQRDAILDINYQGNLNFIIIKIKGNRLSNNFTYEVSYIKNEKYIFISNVKEYNEIVLGIVNTESNNINYSIILLPSNLTLYTITFTKTEIKEIPNANLLAILIFATIITFFALFLILFRRRLSKVFSQET
jgi:hypothetical protein